MGRDESLNSAELDLAAVLRPAVKAFLYLHPNGVRLSELYEVFRHWDSSVTLDLLSCVVQPMLCSTQFQDDADAPEWLSGAGRLLYCGRIVKQFRHPAPNQRRILDAFQTLDWPAQIRNPFFRDRISTEIAIETFRNAAEALNDDHVTPQLVRFGTRGNYSYVYWSLAGLLVRPPHCRP
jgi:hypothetical protein